MSLAKMATELFEPQLLWRFSSDRHRSDGGFNREKDIDKYFASPCPAMDMYPIEGGIQLDIDLPGCNKEDISLNVDGDILSVSGKRSSTIEKNEQGWQYAERRFGEFSRTVRLPFRVSPQNISAKYQDGVLRVLAPEPEKRSEESMIMIE